MKDMTDLNSLHYNRIVCKSITTENINWIVEYADTSVFILFVVRKKEI